MNLDPDWQLIYGQVGRLLETTPEIASYPESSVQTVFGTR